MIQTTPRTLWIFLTLVPLLVWGQNNNPQSDGTRGYIDCDAHGPTDLPLCEKGYFLCQNSRDCLADQMKTCVKCPNEHYITNRNRCAKCSTCSPCLRGREVEVEPCSSITNRKCACIPGYTEDRNGKCIVPKSSVKPNSRVYNTTPYQKPSSSFSNSNRTEFNSDDKVKATTTRPAVTTKPQDGEYHLTNGPNAEHGINDNVLTTIVTLVAIFLVIIVMFVLILFLVWYIKRNDSSHSSDSNLTSITSEESSNNAESQPFITQVQTKRTPDTSEPFILNLISDTPDPPVPERIVGPSEHTEPYSDSTRDLATLGSLNDLPSRAPTPTLGSMDDISDSTASKRIR